MTSRRIFTSLRTTTLIPFALLIIVAVGMTGFLSIQNGQSAVQTITNQVLVETAARVTQNLDTLLGAPHIVNKLHLEAFRQGVISLDDPDSIMRFYYQQAKQFEDSGISFGTTAIGTVDGHFIGANASENYVVLSDDSTRHFIIRFAPDADGARTSTVLRERPDYDATTRSWYQQGLQTNAPSWNINQSFTDPTRIDADAVLQYRDLQGNLVGILTTSISLGQINTFLEQIKVGHAGKIFIFDRDGLLVASSAPENPDAIPSERALELGRLPVSESSNPIVQQAATYLENELPYNNITEPHNFKYTVEGQVYLAEITPYTDGKGLQWFIVVTVPEEDFLGQIQAGNRTTLFAIMAGLAFAILIAYFVAQSIVTPIAELNAAAGSLADGRLESRVAIKQQNEIGELGKSFNNMAERISQQVDEMQTLNAQLEQHVYERTAQLEMANKELEAFSYSVSHDLRAPLRAINGYSRMLMKNLPQDLPGDTREMLVNVRQAARRMDQLITDLLTFSRVSNHELRKSTVHVRRLVNQVIPELAPEIEDRKIEWVIGDLPDCEADSHLLKQVFLNLIGNAVKYSRPRSLPRVEIGSLHADGRIVYFVHDNGVGFSMDNADKLFGVFQRLHSESDFPGTGIGLAVVKRIITRHGGQIWAEAELDKGATFYFTL